MPPCSGNTDTRAAPAAAGEQPYTLRSFEELPRCEAGMITIPGRPGLGIELNEEACALHPYQPHSLRHYTGRLTDIRPPETKPFF